jgi:hypothetical protein
MAGDMQELGNQAAADMGALGATTNLGVGPNLAMQ